MFAVFGANRALDSYVLLPAFWVKIVFAGSLFAGGLVLLARLARPGATVGARRWLVAAPIILLWVLGLTTLVDAAPADRAQLIWGNTWHSCPFNIALLSLPAFVASLWALKQLAPTRLRLAGGASGLAAGGSRRARLWTSLPGARDSVSECLVRSRHLDSHARRRRHRTTRVALVGRGVRLTPAGEGRHITRRPPTYRS